METKTRRYSLKTAEGCKRLIALFIIVILVASLFARLVDTDFGKLKVEKLSVDTRGGSQNYEIYYPAYTTDADKLPAVIVTHGGSINSSAYRQIAYELARRGFVTLAVDAYANGYSEAVISDDRYEGNSDLLDAVETSTEEGLGTVQDRGATLAFATPLGVYDALQYLKSLKFVDSTRVGLTGHSMGAIRSSFATEEECYYYSYNDLMINVLYDTFGQTFTEEEVNQDANELAKARLNADQLEYYEFLAQANKEIYDAKLLALYDLGVDPWFISLFDHLRAFDPKVVNVGGHEVTRVCKCNIGFLSGKFEMQTAVSVTDELTKAGFFTTDDMSYESWYIMDDINGTSQIVGTFGQLTDQEYAQIAEAAQNRSLRIYTSVENAHSEEYFSKKVVNKIVQYFELTLDAKSELAPTDQMWQWRVVFNCIAMFAMIGLAFPIIALLGKTKYYASIIAERAPTEKRPFVRKPVYICVSVLTVIAGFFFTHIALTQYASIFTKSIANGKIFMVASGVNGGKFYIFFMAIASIVFLAIYAIANKQATGETGVAALNIGMNVKAVLKTILAALIVLVVQYALLQVCEYWFDEDFRLWQTVFDQIRPERWVALIPNFILLLPCFLLIGAATNYPDNDSKSEAWNTVLTVVIGSLGTWLCALYTQYQFHALGMGTPWTDYLVGYGLNLMVPLTLYITRKMYKITNSIWAGAAVNSFLVCWTWIAFNGLEEAAAVQNWLSTVLGA